MIENRARRHFCDYPRRSPRRASYNIHPLSRFRWRFTNSACRCYPEATRSQPSFRHHPASLALAPCRRRLFSPCASRYIHTGFISSRARIIFGVFSRGLLIYALTLSRPRALSIRLSFVTPLALTRAHHRGARCVTRVLLSHRVIVLFLSRQNRPIRLVQAFSRFAASTARAFVRSDRTISKDRLSREVDF